MTFSVVAAVEGKARPWRVILTTKDRAHAEAMLAQFHQANVPARIESWGQNCKECSE